MLKATPDFNGLSIGRAQRQAAGLFRTSETPMLDARILIKAALGLDDAALIASERRDVTQQEAEVFRSLVIRRMRSEPIAHIVGSREFWGLDILVKPGILVPRADSEVIISIATNKRSLDAPLRVLDLGTGSGCLLCALFASFPNAHGIGVDINPIAVELAEKNLSRLGFSERATILNSNWMDEVHGQFDLIVSNPPYIPTHDEGVLPQEVRDYEDHTALFSGPDGMDDYRRILGNIRSYLAPQSLLIFEVGDGQAEALEVCFGQLGPPINMGIEADLRDMPRAIWADFSTV